MAGVLVSKRTPLLCAAIVPSEPGRLVLIGARDDGKLDRPWLDNRVLSADEPTDLADPDAAKTRWVLQAAWDLNVDLGGSA